MTKEMYIGWAQAILSVIVFLGLANVVGRYSAYILQVNPIVFSCAAFSSCAFVLLIIGGKGSLSKETMRSIDTWVYGTILMMSYIFGMLLVFHVTSTEATMLQKVSILLGLLGSWFFLGRSPDRYQLIGTVIITFAVIMVCIGIEGENTGSIYTLSFLYGAMQTARIFTAELHRPHAQAAQRVNDPRAKARVVGFIMFTMSLIFLMTTLLIAFAQEQQGQPFMSILPMLDDFTHPASIFSGLIMGICIIAPLRVLEFSSTQIIKAENVTAVTSFSFVATFFWEWATSPLTGLSIKDVSGMDIIAGILITIGGLIITLTRTRSKNKKAPRWQEYLAYQPQNLAAIDDSREMVANTLEHYNGDIKKSAKALAIPTPVIQALIDDSEKVLAFKDQPLRQIARKYRKKVAMSDALTGLANRSAFMTALKTAPYEEDQFSILYIDLDKFKPVNDTHGHEVGDKVLKMVAERLQKISPKQSIITRMGGDEYCILLLGATPKTTAKMVKTVKEEISQPYNVAGVKESIHVSASIGLANYPEDGSNPKELLAIADKGMFGVKHSRD